MIKLIIRSGLIAYCQEHRLALDGPPLDLSQSES